MEIREAQIEDIIVNLPPLACRLLNLEEPPRLLARQMIIPSGRLDLLYTYRMLLLLVELKVVPFKRDFLNQVLDYKSELINLQKKGMLVQGCVKPYLLCTSVKTSDYKLADEVGVICLEYNPEEALLYFYDNFKPIASLSSIKPADFGIWNLHLINDLISSVEKEQSLENLHKRIGGSRKTLHNKIKFACELRLINWYPKEDKIVLTNLGNDYLQRKSFDFPHRISEEQAALLKKLVVNNPYESPVTIGIASVIESVFTLSKNLYPIPMDLLIQYFSFHAGKFFDWKTEKAKYSATRMYSNYATDLGLLAKTDNHIYLTPEGIRFLFQMQLHKSLKMTDTITIS